VAASDYEWGMLAQRPGLTEAQVADKVNALVTTKGANGSRAVVDRRVAVMRIELV